MVLMSCSSPIATWRYQHVIETMERLQGIASSVRIAQAVEGKDLTDHTAAGHDIEELTAIDPVAKLAELEPASPTEDSSAEGPPPPGGGGGFRGDQSVPVHYRRRSTAVFAISSACSAAARERQVIPPPLPYDGRSVLLSTTAVRMATLNRARTGAPGGPTQPTAPQ